MYKYVEVKQVPEFDNYNIIISLGIIYKYIIEYSNLLLSSKHNRLLAANSIKNPRITTEQILVFKIVLNNYVN